MAKCIATLLNHATFTDMQSGRTFRRGAAVSVDAGLAARLKTDPRFSVQEIAQKEKVKSASKTVVEDNGEGDEGGDEGGKEVTTPPKKTPSKKKTAANA